jgi:hypothetical protein
MVIMMSWVEYDIVLRYYSSVQLEEPRKTLEISVSAAGPWLGFELDGIFGPVREEILGQWRKLHIEELHSFIIFTVQYSINFIRVIR